jgi:hypothetical protein
VEPEYGSLLQRLVTASVNAEDEVRLTRLILNNLDSGNVTSATNDFLTLLNRIKEKYGTITIT